MFNALADSRKNVVCEECSAMSANQKSTESDKDRDSDDYDNDYDNFAPPPHQNNQNNQQQNNIQQQQGKLYILFVYQCWYQSKLMISKIPMYDFTVYCRR